MLVCTVLISREFRITSYLNHLDMSNIHLTFTMMIGRLFAILGISGLQIVDSFSLTSFKECLQVHFVDGIQEVSNDIKDTKSTFVRIDLNNIPQDFARQMENEWKHSCILAQIIGGSSDTSIQLDAILWFMQTLKANKKALIVGRNLEHTNILTKKIKSIHRSYDILWKEESGTLEHYPILGIQASRGSILQVGYLFIWPYILRSKQGQLSGTDIKALDLLAKKYGFDYELSMFNRMLMSTLPNGTKIGVFPDVSIPNGFHKYLLAWNDNTIAKSTESWT